MAKITKKEKKEAKKAALTLVETAKPVNKEVKPEESTEEGDPEPATEEKTVDVEVKPEDPTPEASISEALDDLASKIPESITADQMIEILEIEKLHGRDEAIRSAKNIDETNKEITIANEKIEADRLAREEKAVTFKKYVEGDLEIPGDLDDEAKTAIIQAQNHLPRNIMCQGSHAFCSINEMSKDKPRYSINFLKKKGLIK